MKLKSKKKGKIWIIEIEGAIKSGMEFDLAEKLEFCLREAEVPKFIIDLKQVPFINSSALGIFLNVFRESEKSNGRFSLCSISNEVDNLLDITKLNSVFEIFKNQEDALDSFQD